MNLATLNQEWARTKAAAAKNDFWVFHLAIASVGIKAVEGEFVGGAHIKDFCHRLQSSKETVTMAFRNASKSVTLRSFLMWQLFRCDRAFAEFSYFSFKTDFAGYHLSKAKRYIESCPYFAPFKSLTDAESILRYKTPTGGIWECYPEGILAFKRGLHRDGVILDDVLKDPSQVLDLSQVEKISRVIREEVLSIPKIGGFFHLVGTPQDQSDIFYQLKDNPAFNFQEYPSERMVDGERVAIWPEHLPLDELDRRKERLGQKAYQKEYLLQPVRSAEAYFSQDEIEELTDYDLPNHKIGGTPKDYGLEGVEVFAGMDLGKKRHPSHLSVWARRPTKSGDDYRLEQIHSSWFDQVNYVDQLNYAKQAIESFGIRSLRYDNTRAELEALDELGEVPREMDPVVMTSSRLFQAASALDRVVSSGRISFLDDERQLRQICSVDNNLKAPVTAEGHGDAFFSAALAVQAATEEVAEPAIFFA